MGECLSDTDSDGTDNASSSGRESSVDMKAKSRTENGEFCVRGSGIQSKPNSLLSESECSDMPSLLTISDDSDAESEPDPDESLELESEHGCPTRGAAASGPSDVCSDGLSDVAPSNTPWWSYPLWEKNHGTMVAKLRSCAIAAHDSRIIMFWLGHRSFCDAGIATPSSHIVLF